jgi:hypothetical protein
MGKHRSNVLNTKGPTKYAPRHDQPGAIQTEAEAARKAAMVIGVKKKEDKK